LELIRLISIIFAPLDGSTKSDCIKKRPKLFIEKIMPVNLLNENASV